MVSISACRGKFESGRWHQLSDTHNAVPASFFLQLRIQSLLHNFEDQNSHDLNDPRKAKALHDKRLWSPHPCPPPSVWSEEACWMRWNVIEKQISLVRDTVTWTTENLIQDVETVCTHIHKHTQKNIPPSFVSVSVSFAVMQCAVSSVIFLLCDSIGGCRGLKWGSCGVCVLGLRLLSCSVFGLWRARRARLSLGGI